MKDFLVNIWSSIRGSRNKNITVVVLCIIVATIFWFFNALNKDYSTNLRYPVEFVFDDSRYVAISKLPEDIMMNVSGVGWNLLRKSLGFRVEPIKVLLEDPAETDKIAGGSLPGIITDQMTDIQLNYVITDTLVLTIDRKIKKPYVLAVDTSSIDLDPDFIMAGMIELSTDSIWLEGPESMLLEMGDTVFVALDDRGIDEDFSEEVEIEVLSRGLIRRDPPTVTISFTVSELIASELSVPVNTNEIDQFLGYSYQISDSVLTIEFLFPENQDAPDVGDFEAVFDMNSFNTMDSTIRPAIQRYPSYIRNLKFDTTRVKVRFREEL